MNWPFPRHPWPESKQSPHSFDQGPNRPFYSRKTSRRRSRTAKPRQSPSPPTKTAPKPPPLFESLPSFPSPSSSSVYTQLLLLYSLPRGLRGFSQFFLRENWKENGKEKEKGNFRGKVGSLNRWRGEHLTLENTERQDSDLLWRKYPYYCTKITVLPYSFGVDLAGSEGILEKWNLNRWILCMGGERNRQQKHGQDNEFFSIYLNNYIIFIIIFLHKLMDNINEVPQDFTNSVASNDLIKISQSKVIYQSSWKEILYNKSFFSNVSKREHIKYIFEQNSTK